MKVLRKLSSFSFLLLFFPFTAFTADLDQYEPYDEPIDDEERDGDIISEFEEQLNEKCKKATQVENPGQRKHGRAYSEGNRKHRSEGDEKKSDKKSPDIKRVKDQFYRTVTPKERPNTNNPKIRRDFKSSRNLVYYNPKD